VDGWRAQLRPFHGRSRRWRGRLILLGASAVLLLGITNYDALNKWVRPSPAAAAAAPMLRPGEVWVYAAARHIDAYTQLTAKDLTRSLGSVARLRGQDVILNPREIWDGTHAWSLKPTSRSGSALARKTRERRQRHAGAWLRGAAAGPDPDRRQTQ